LIGSNRLDKMKRDKPPTHIPKLLPYDLSASSIVSGIQLVEEDIAEATNLKETKERPKPENSKNTRFSAQCEQLGVG
jgi:hypothetical protein